MKCYQWYSQSCGGILGIASCIYCYLKGNLLIYSNLDGNFDVINFNGILASYTLYPLCLSTFIMAIFLAIPSMNQKKIINIEVTKINSVLIYLTTIIGILGCGIYFILPALLLLFKNLCYIFKYYHSKSNNKQTTTIHDNEVDQELKYTSTKLLSTKTEMAINLLNKGANINFISEVTGLSQDYITNLKGEEINLQ